MERGAVICQCKGEGGNPPAAVTWHRDGAKISEANEENLLALHRISREESGRYKCVAQSSIVADEISVDIFVNCKSYVSNGKTYSIYVVNYSHSGSYRCIAKNALGKRSNENIYKLLP